MSFHNHLIFADTMDEGITIERAIVYSLTSQVREATTTEGIEPHWRSLVW